MNERLYICPGDAIQYFNSVFHLNKTALVGQSSVLHLVDPVKMMCKYILLHCVIEQGMILFVKMCLFLCPSWRI